MLKEVWTKKLTYFSIQMCIGNPTELKSVATEPHLKTSPDTHIMKIYEKIVHQLNLIYRHLKDNLPTKPVISALIEYCGLLLSSCPDLLTCIEVCHSTSVYKRKKSIIINICYTKYNFILNN